MNPPKEMLALFEQMHKDSDYVPLVLLHSKFDGIKCLMCETEDFARTSRSADVRQEIVTCLNCGRRWRLRFRHVPEAIQKFPRMSTRDVNREIRERAERKARPN